MKKIANSAKFTQPRSGEIIVANAFPFPFPPIEHIVYGSYLKIEIVLEVKNPASQVSALPLQNKKGRETGPTYPKVKNGQKS